MERGRLVRVKLSFAVSLERSRMLYIIDGNNLAGALNLLGRRDFDQELISLISSHFQLKLIDVFLVFDSVLQMGDKRQFGNVQVVYAPRDEFYEDADAKIVEIIEMVNGFKPSFLKLVAPLEGVIVVTSDSALREKVAEIFKESKNYLPIELIRSEDFALKLKAVEEYGEDEKNIGRKKRGKLDQELLDLWGKAKQ